MVPGHCKHKAHDRANLGLGGRRVLVSRMWTGKTLAGHRADRAAVVRAALEEAGIDPDDHDELSISGTDGRWSWELFGRSRVDERTYAAAIAEQITTRQRWRAQYETAKATTAARAGPAPPAAVVRQFDPTAERKGVTGGLRTFDGAEGAHALHARGDSDDASARSEQALLVDGSWEPPVGDGRWLSQDSGNCARGVRRGARSRTAGRRSVRLALADGCLVGCPPAEREGGRGTALAVVPGQRGGPVARSEGLEPPTF
jgi:hypothetical protein